MDIEIQIAEMWDALAESRDHCTDEEYNAAHQEAREIERRLRSSYAAEEQARSDAHSCTANSQYTYFGPAGPGSYCTECGALVQSSDAERHAFDHDEN